METTHQPSSSLLREHMASAAQEVLRTYDTDMNHPYGRQPSIIPDACGIQAASDTRLFYRLLGDIDRLVTRGVLECQRMRHDSALGTQRGDNPGIPGYSPESLAEQRTIIEAMLTAIWNSSRIMPPQTISCR